MSSFNPLRWIAHQVDLTDHKYKVLQKNLRDEAGLIQLASVVGIVASAVYFFFGLTENKISSVFISAALGYVSYNMYRVGENYHEVAKNPNNFDAMFGWSDVIGKKKQSDPMLKKCLEKNTFYFGAFVDFIVKHVVDLKH